METEHVNYKAIREGLNLTQIEMAVKADVSLSTIQAVESGRAKNMHPRIRRKLAEAYGVPLDHIPGGTATAAVPAA